MKIEWEADDGYAGGSRPQSFEIDNEEIKENCDSLEEALKYIEEETQMDFDNKVTWYFNNLDEIKEKVISIIQARKIIS